MVVFHEYIEKVIGNERKDKQSSKNPCDDHNCNADHRSSLLFNKIRQLEQRGRELEFVSKTTQHIVISTLTKAKGLARYLCLPCLDQRRHQRYREGQIQLLQS